MKKTITILLLSLSGTLAGTAQTENHRERTVQLSDPYQKSHSPEKNIFVSGNEILHVWADEKDVILNKFDAQSLKLLATSKVEVLSVYSHVEKIMQLNNKVIIFYSLYDKKAEQDNLYYREADWKTATLGPEVSILQFNNELINGKSTKTPGEYKRTVYTDKYDFYPTPDSSKLLIQYKIDPPEKAEDNLPEEIGLCLLDQNLKTEWNKRIIMPYSNEELRILDVEIDPELNVFLLAAIDADIKKVGKVSRLELLKIPAASTKIIVAPVEIEGISSIKSIGLFQSVDSSIKCVAVFLPHHSGNGILSFSTKISGDIYNLEKYFFSEAIAKQNITPSALKYMEKIEMKNDKEGKTTNYWIPNIILREVIVKKDGSTIIIAESIYSLTANATHLEEIVIIKTGKDNKLSWMKKLAKMQQGDHLQSLSYKYIHHNNTHVLLYCDNPENYYLKDTEVPKKFYGGKDGYLMSYEIDEEGNAQKNFLMDMKKNNSGESIKVINLVNPVVVHNSEIIFEVYVKFSNSLMKIKAAQ